MSENNKYLDNMIKSISHHLHFHNSSAMLDKLVEILNSKNPFDLNIANQIQVGGVKCVIELLNFTQIRPTT